MHKSSTVVPVLKQGVWTKAPATFLPLQASDNWQKNT